LVAFAALPLEPGAGIVPASRLSGYFGLLRLGSFRGVAARALFSARGRHRGRLHAGVVTLTIAFLRKTGGVAEGIRRVCEKVSAADCLLIRSTRVLLVAIISRNALPRVCRALACHQGRGLRPAGFRAE